MTTWTMEDAQAGDWQEAYRKLEQYWHEHRDNEEFLHALSLYEDDSRFDVADTPRRVVILNDPDNAEEENLEPPRGILLATKKVRSVCPYLVLVGGRFTTRWTKGYGWWVPTIADFVPPVAPNLLVRKRRRLKL